MKDQAKLEEVIAKYDKEKQNIIKNKFDWDEFD